MTRKNETKSVEREKYSSPLLCDIGLGVNASILNTSFTSTDDNIDDLGGEIDFEW